MNNVKSWLKSVMVIITVMVVSSCAVVKATNQPDKKDLRVLQKGTERAKVVAELGKPVESTVKNGHRQDVFSFVQGYSKTTKTLRALGHGAADVYTLGLWEVVGTPIEGAANGNQVQVAIIYDNHEKVSSVNVFKGQNTVYGSPRRHHHG